MNHKAFHGLTLPVEPRTLNSSLSAFPSRFRSIIKNLRGCMHQTYVLPQRRLHEKPHRWSLTRVARSMMFCGHAFLNLAPRFSGTGALGTFVLRARFRFGGESMAMGLLADPAAVAP